MDQAFHEYQEVTQLAKGAAGSRYRARASNDDVIIQVYEFVYLSSTQEQERFQQECKQLQQLRHPFISQLQDAGTEQDHPYLVNKAISDDSLRSRLSSARIPLGKALSIIIRTGQALSYAHTWNILHTNIRPENILFKARDQVILADFLPRSITESWLDPQNACYVAPEQFSGLYSTSSDQYALGCVAYELFTGQPPFTAIDLSMSQAMHSKERPAPLTSLVPDLPKHINDAVLKALAKKPAERHASISDFLAALTARSAPATVDLSSAEVPQEPFPEETPDEEPTDLFPIFQQDQVAKKETESFFNLPLNEPAVEHHPPEVLPNDAPAFSEPPNIPSPAAANRGHVPEPTPSATRRSATSGHKKTSRSVWIALSVACLLMLGLGLIVFPLRPGQGNPTTSISTPTIVAITTATARAEVTPTIAPTTIPQPTPTQLQPTATTPPTPKPIPAHTPTPTPKPAPKPTPKPTPCQCLFCLC